MPISEVRKLGKKPSKSKILLGWKTDVFYPGGELGPAGERTKARWIICGWSMIFGLDFSLTSSLTAGMTGSRMMT